MAVIIFCRISLFKRNFLLYPSSVVLDGIPPDDMGGECVFLYPSISYDGRISLSDMRADFEDYALASLCAGLFLTEGRGLPLDELDFESPTEIYSTRMNKTLHRHGIILSKCKVLYTKRPLLISNVEIFYSSLVSFSKIIRVVKCAGSRAFSDSSLRSLLYNGTPECIDAALAYSGERGEYFATAVSLSDTLPTLSLVRAVATDALSVDSGLENIGVTIDGARYDVSRFGARLLISDPEARLRLN